MKEDQEEQVIDPRLTREVLIERINASIRAAEEAEAWYRAKAERAKNNPIPFPVSEVIYRERADNEKIKAALLRDLLRDVS